MIDTRANILVILGRFIKENNLIDKIEPSKTTIKVASGSVDLVQGVLKNAPL